MTVVARSQEMTPTINVKIPNPFLADSENSEDNTYESSAGMSYQAATLKPYEPKQLWPSPISEALQQLSKIDLSATNVCSPMIDDPHVNSSDDFMYDSAMFDPVPRVPPASPEDQNLMMEDYGDSGDFQDEGIVTEPKMPALGSGSPSRSMPNKAAAMKRQQYGYSLFFKGGQSRVHFQGTSDASSVLAQPQKEASDAVVASEALDMAKDSSLIPNMAKMLSPYSKSIQRPIFYRTISHKAGLKDLVSSRNIPLKNEGQGDGTNRPSSSVYEADEESEAPSPEVPAMGSRREWDKARADRYNRYFAIRSMDDDEKTEADSESGLELERSPARRPLEDAVSTLTEPDTTRSAQDVDSTVPNDEIADSQEKTPESPRKPILYTVKTAGKNLSELNLGLPKESRAGLAKSDLHKGLETHEWSPLEPLMTGHLVDAEAALHRLIERNQDWSSTSSYDSDDELYIQYEKPGDVTSFPAASGPSIQDQERKSTGTEELDLGCALSPKQSRILEDAATGNREETDPYDYYSLGSGVVWSRLSKMDVPGSTEFLKADAVEGNNEGSKCILSEDECTPLDESPVYLNPRPFPDLKEYRDDPDPTSSVITESSLTDQADRLALLAQQESPISPCLPVDAYERFWADLGQDCMGFIVKSQAAKKQGEQDPKGSQDIHDDLMVELDEMRVTRHELNDPDRAFNAARLPGFNSIPSTALQSLSEVQGRVFEGASPGPTSDKKEIKTTSSGRAAHRRSGRIKLPPKKTNCSPSKPKSGRDQTSPGKKGVWWASNVEYIDKSNSVLTEKSNETKRGAGRAKISINIPQEKVPKKFAYRLQGQSDMENRSDTVTEW